MLKRHELEMRAKRCAELKGLMQPQKKGSFDDPQPSSSFCSSIQPPSSVESKITCELPCELKNDVEMITI